MIRCRVQTCSKEVPLIIIICPAITNLVLNDTVKNEHATVMLKLHDTGATFAPE